MATFTTTTTTTATNGGGDLTASRAKGSARQLFRAGDRKEGEENEEDFLLRPNATRREAKLARKIQAEMPFLSDCSGQRDIQRMELADINSDKFEKSHLSDPDKTAPVLITKSTLEFQWPAGGKHWSPDALGESLGRDTRLEVALLDATASLGDYIDYMKSDEAKTDDNPVYVFETLVEGEHDRLISKFQVPTVFTGKHIAVALTLPCRKLPYTLSYACGLTNTLPFPALPCQA
jgi:hypothetical protein